MFDKIWSYGSSLYNISHLKVLFLDLKIGSEEINNNNEDIDDNTDDNMKTTPP